MQGLGLPAGGFVGVYGGGKINAVRCFDVPFSVPLHPRGRVREGISRLGDAGFCRAVSPVHRACRPPRRAHGCERNACLGGVLAGAVGGAAAVRLSAGSAGGLAGDGLAPLCRLVRAGALRDAGAGAQRQSGFSGRCGGIFPAAVRQFLPAGAHGVFCAENWPAWPHQSP